MLNIGHREIMEEGGAIACPQPGGQTGKESLLEPEQGCWRGRHKSRVTATRRDLTSLFCQPVYSWRSPQAKPQKEGKSREAVLWVHTHHTAGKRAGERGSLQGLGHSPQQHKTVSESRGMLEGQHPLGSWPILRRVFFFCPQH